MSQAFAQNCVATRAADRISGAIDDRARLPRAGNRHPMARPAFARGLVAPNFRKDRMMLVLEPSEAQRRDLEQLLAAQQDPASPVYHQWLTPEDFGDRYGVSNSDYSKVEDWLRSPGFDV